MYHSCALFRLASSLEIFVAAFVAIPACGANPPSAVTIFTKMAAHAQYLAPRKPKEVCSGGLLSRHTVVILRRFAVIGVLA